MNNPADEISQAERRRILAEERRGQTYMGHAIATADEDRGGRYAAESKQTVVGSSPIQYPQQPASSPFACDPVGKEPPLGYEIDAQEPVGEKFEVAASLAGAAPGIESSSSSVAAPADVGGRSGRPPTAAPPTQSKFRRRV